MIRFSLLCSEAHGFDSWFGSGADFDRLSSNGLIACPVCGSVDIRKDLMAPNVVGAGTSDLTEAASPMERALAEFRRHVESVSEDVGRNFAAEARRIHEGEAPARPIIGEAEVKEARALLEDGIAIAPLPWAARKAN